MKALVVDDSRVMRAIVSRVLVDCGYEVAEARHGREALAYLQAHADTGLAVIDWNMPEMNGLELVRAVRADPDLAAVRLVMVTTETELAHVALAIDAGVDEYVMKPFTKSMIEDKLRLLDLPTASEAQA
jgi:two-component system, chemotaxis family, chemotaxis protein CheY